MKGFDAFAGVIKSGGKTRRAAKMVILNVEHPDVLEFIHCKADEERKACADRCGLRRSFNGEAYNSIFFQNANHSVRVTDEFMEAVVHDRQATPARSPPAASPTPIEPASYGTRSPRPLTQCGDPACSSIRRSTTGTSPCRTRRVSTPRTRARSTCSSTIAPATWPRWNLRKFQFPRGTGRGCTSTSRPLSTPVDITILAQEIIVDNARYPTERIGDNSQVPTAGARLRNLARLLMSRGLPYDSDAGRPLLAP